MWGVRRCILRLFGATIGSHVHIHPTVSISIPWNLKIGDGTAIGDRAILYALGPITIGKSVTVSQYAHICAGTHDYSTQAMELKKCSITIDDGAWICADAFVGPDVIIGKGAVIGARAVAMKDISSNKIVAGNPAKEIGSRQH